jgi:phosphoenolpyruvate carboxykinase (GTP)
LPGIFHVNWFRQDADGRFLWPGFGENLRVLQWIIDRCEGRVDAVETPIGYLPNVQDFNTTGLEVDPADLKTLTSIDPPQWKTEVNAIASYLESYGERLPNALREQLQKVSADLSASGTENAS